MDRARNKILDEIMSFNTSEEAKKLINIIKSYSGEELYKLHKLNDEKMKEIELFLINCYGAKRILENIESEKFASLREKLMTSPFYFLEIDYLRNMTAIANYFTDLSIDSLAYKYYVTVKETQDLAHNIEELLKNLKLPENEDEVVISSINTNKEEILLSQKEYEELYDENFVLLYESYLNDDFASYDEIFWEITKIAIDKELNIVFNNLDYFSAIANILLNTKMDKIVPALMLKLLAVFKKNVEETNALVDTIFPSQIQDIFDMIESILGR